MTPLAVARLGFGYSALSIATLGLLGGVPAVVEDVEAWVLATGIPMTLVESSSAVRTLLEASGHVLTFVDASGVLRTVVDASGELNTEVDASGTVLVEVTATGHQKEN
jgi:hypothetical protein